MRQQQRVATHLGEIEYTDRGTGPVLVFLHLVFAAGDHWDELVELLSDRHRCIALTLPLGAHQVPAKPDADLSPPGLAGAIAEVLEALDLYDVTLVGNDTGGALAQIVATDFGERVGSIVLTNCDLYHEFPPKMFARLLKPLARVPASFALGARLLAYKRVWNLPFVFGLLAHELDPVRLDRWRRRLLDPSVRRDVSKVIRGMDPVHTERAAAKLRQTDIPVLIAWGADDTAFDVTNAQRMAREVPTARLVMVPDARAAVCWDQPEVLANLIRGHEQERHKRC